MRKITRSDKLVWAVIDTGFDRILSIHTSRSAARKAWMANSAKCTVRRGWFRVEVEKRR
jgi:hypothetical protein